MKMNNFMFKEEYAYIYSEILTTLGFIFQENPYSKQIFANNLLVSKLIELDNGHYMNTMGYSFLDDNKTAVSQFVKDNAQAILQKVFLRYKDHYAVVVASQDDFSDECKKFFIKVCNVLDYTFDKYDTLLTIYAEQKTHLLDKLQRIRDEEKTLSSSGEHSETRDETRNLERGTEIDTESGSSSKSAGSDTPQTINVSQDIGEIAGYFNKYDQAEDSGTSHSEGTDTDTGTIGVEIGGENSSSGSEELDATESYDPMTMMARIEEIQTKYENTMFKWVEEFDRLFIEEGNI